MVWSQPLSTGILLLEVFTFLGHFQLQAPKKVIDFVWMSKIINFDKVSSKDLELQEFYFFVETERSARILWTH